MKYIITESQFHFIIKEDYEDEMKKYKEIIVYRNAVAKKSEEIFNIINEMEHLFRPSSKVYPYNGLKIMDNFIEGYMKDKKNSSYSCSNKPKKNEINPSNFFVETGFSEPNKEFTKLKSSESQKVMSLYIQAINKIKELNSLNKPSGYVPIGCLTASILNGFKNGGKKYIRYMISFIYPMVPIPPKPKKPKIPVAKPTVPDTKITSLIPDKKVHEPKPIVPISTKPLETNFSVTWRDNMGKQNSHYFSSYEEWKKFTDQFDTYVNKSENNSKTSAEALYNQNLNLTKDRNY